MFQTRQAEFDQHHDTVICMPGGNDVHISRVLVAWCERKKRERLETGIRPYYRGDIPVQNITEHYGHKILRSE